MDEGYGGEVRKERIDGRGKPGKLAHAKVSATLLTTLHIRDEERTRVKM